MKLYISFLGLVETVCLVHRPLFDLLYQLQMMDYNECGAVGGIIGMRN
jgi:hypothetical protein